MPLTATTTIQAALPLIAFQSLSPCRTMASASPTQKTRYHLWVPLTASPMK